MNARQGLVAAFAAALALAAPGLASAQGDDAGEVGRYVLTDAGLAKFTQATRNVAAVPGACERQDDDGDDLKSIDQMVAKMNSLPGIQAAIQSAGMTTREYVVFMFSMMQSGMASWALKQPGGKLPPGISQANVDFYDRNAAAMAQLGADDPCGDDAAGDDE
jgi:hypothetical protein